ncbi:anthranilate synthase component I family protein [Angustibacter sp. Root456]|uniref:chorismate-binding protein n=1 Tax=Angustibacter sp. Root456 TaxID=1736539 RepID=UPI0006F24064|nr:anthranilate synthase component I family protein [Angustibacter sp. Root456]KQX66898.1 chloride transporter [Angustibacter sp. Root456]
MTATSSARAALAWFGGRLARQLVEVVDAHGPDEVASALARLERTGGWWAVVGEFEGRVRLARFATVREAPLPPSPRGWPGLHPAGWTTSLQHEQYLAACEEVRDRIGCGEVYQVNVCRVLSRRIDPDADLLALAAAVQRDNPAPYAGYVRLPGLEVVCASPELFLERAGRRVRTGPIKGTATEASRLLPKDVDENVMIVDLARNDLSTVCEPGSVEVPALLAAEAHPGLVHLVSRVEGELRAGSGWPDLWAATMPPASVTGAPKSSALRAITDLERSARGPYCGAVGWIDADAGTARLAVGIRTFWADGDPAGERVLRFGTGAGVTWGSDPQGEWDETELKAATLLAVAARPHGARRGL